MTKRYFCQKIFKKPNLLKFGVLLFSFVFLAQMFSPFEAKAWDGPCFNCLPEDQELLRMKNRTEGDTEWHDPLFNAEDADRIDFLVYYHNAAPGTTAENTKIKIDFPTAYQTTIVTQGKVWADNSVNQPEDYGTIYTQGGQGLLLNFIDVATQAKWYHTESGYDLIPITFSEGSVQVNIGNVEGCWDIGTGFVVFEAKLEAAPSFPALTISKLGRNLSQGQISFTNSISAVPLEQIEFEIEVSSTGDTTANNVMVKDVLPDKMSYSGNLKVNGSSVSGNILSGINIGNLAVGVTKTITFEAVIFSEGYFGYGTTALINIGQTWANDVSQISDTASVSVFRESPSPVSPGLSISKLVRNITDSTSFSESVSADPLDRIEFRILVTSIGSNTAQDVILRDTLPSDLTYQGNLKINGVSSAGNILSGFNIGNLAPAVSKIITFKAKVASKGNFGYGTTTLVNTANVRADTLAKIYDSATTNVFREAPSQVTLSINKKAKNLTKGQTSWYETISAKPSDLITFRIIVTSTGGTTASNVIVKDGLPGKIDWYGNLEINGVASSLDITDGVSIGNLSPGTSKTITFKAKVVGEDNFVYGTTDLTNVAMAYNVDTSVTDTAKVRVIRTAVAGAVTETPTGVLSSLLISFGVTLLLSYCFLLGFFFYQKVFVRSGIRLGDEISRLKSTATDWYLSLNLFDSPERSERRLQKTISEIRRKEK